MKYQSNRGGFSRTHLPCPCPQQEQRCCSEFADSPDLMYCHACARVVRVSNQRRPHYEQRSIKVALPEQRYVNLEMVATTTASVNEFHAIFQCAEGYLECYREYPELRAKGFDHDSAFRQSGWRQWAQTRLVEMNHELVRLPSFAAAFLAATQSPEVLSHFKVGFRDPDEVVYWIIGPDHRISNGHGVKYGGLNRNKNVPARFLFTASEGYRTDEFFGAHQLGIGARTWTGSPFLPDADVMIVESPKSALLCSFMYPDTIWLASCGTSGVTAIKARHLKGRIVKILFDNDESGLTGSNRALSALLEAGARPVILNPEKVFNGQRPNGWDVGDEVLSLLGERS